MFEESFRYATASFRGSTQHFTDPGETCAKTGVCSRNKQHAAGRSHLTANDPDTDESLRGASLRLQKISPPGGGDPILQARI
ncbi:hypothetical protein PQR68_35365 [Paraburkholderia agricolaris]|uniref:hypothetical protein n=1 Tax=Paraburkholderia agricolaris TaxID=2152888 RepID=UPI0038BC4254